MALIKCEECRQEISDKASTCPHCGYPLLKKRKFNDKDNIYVDFVEKKRLALIAVFLGGLGFHKFILDKKLQGWVYLLFSWTFIPSSIGVIEGCGYLTISNKDFYEKYKMLPPDKVKSDILYAERPKFLIRFFASFGQIIGGLSLLFSIIWPISFTDRSGKQYHSDTKEEAEKKEIIRKLDILDATKKEASHYY